APGLRLPALAPGLNDARARLLDHLGDHPGGRRAPRAKRSGFGGGAGDDRGRDRMIRHACGERDASEQEPELHGRLPRTAGEQLYTRDLATASTPTPCAFSQSRIARESSSPTAQERC